MKRILFALLCVSTCFATAFAQNDKEPILRVELQYDTVGLYEQFQIKFSLENAQSAKFHTPDFGDFMLVGGPFQSSQFSMINGITSSSTTHTYILQPKETGSFVIPKTTVNVGTETFTFPEVALVVTTEVQRQAPSSPFGTMPNFDDNAMNELYKRQEDMFKRHQDMFNDPNGFFNDPMGMFKDLERRMGPGLMEMFKNMEDAFPFKMPPVEQPKPKEKTYKL